MKKNDFNAKKKNQIKKENNFFVSFACQTLQIYNRIFKK